MLFRVVKGVTEASRKALLDTIEQLLFPNPMATLEARKILNLNESYKQRDLDKAYMDFYSLNSKERNGSPYIQKKIKAAYAYLKQ